MVGIIIIVLASFFTQALAGDFSLSSKWQQVTSGVQDSSHNNNSVVLVVSIRPPISDFSNPLSKPFGIVLSTPLTIGITVILMLHKFLST